MRRLLLAALVALALWPSIALGETAVTEVRVRGNLRVEAARILQVVTTRAGESYDPEKVREDIRAIYRLGYFDDIVVELDDRGVLTFVVRERPALREWRLEGGDRLDAEDVEKAVPLRRREILDRAQVDEGARAIRDLYREKGYYLAEVTSEIVEVADGKNHVDVIYRVTEGEKVRVKDVNLIGVRQKDEKQIRKFLATRRTGAWSWLTGAGTFKDTDLQRDTEVIRSLYLDSGYVDVEVRDPLVSLTADRKWLKVDIPVVEGESYTLGAVSFAGDLEFPEERLREAAQLVEGDTFSAEALRRARQSVEDLYADVGYAFAEVDPQTRLDRDARRLDVTFRIHKGDPVRIGRIEVRGNSKTRDRILRREMQLAEGDLYSASAIRKSKRRVENLNFFETVNLTTHRRPGTDLVDVLIEVEEKPTGSFSVGAGYSSVDNLIGMFNISQSNLFGYAYQLSLQANLSSSRQSYSFTFNNPRVFDSDWYVGMDLYNTTREYLDYDKDAKGGDVKLGTSLGEHWRVRWIYRWERARVDADEGVTRFILDQEGTTITSSITPVLTYDSRDNAWDPSRGMTADASVEWAGGALGGNAEFVKLGLESSKYVPLWWEHVLTLHGRIGYIRSLGNEIPVYERYYLGGITSLRGFETRSIGPEEEGDVIGGTKELLFNVEYVFPLIREAKVKGVVFYDAGNAWGQGDRYFEGGLRQDAGAGIRWFSPMGPLRLEWGYVLDRKEGEAPSQWQFMIGGFF
ncbi:MAG: outer membrane protein assembly factor BamA [Deferrisomatales bacterium]